jgi:two-component system chemotaxis response regulator CheB
MPNIAIIGMSTGGPKTLAPLFEGMPAVNGCIILVQHMPQFINEGILATITRLAPGMQASIAQQGDRIKPGRVFIAPSEVHLRLEDNRSISLGGTEKVNYVCPSIDATMQSVQRAPGAVLIGAVMTGMGCDGAAGIQHLKHIGAITLAQNEQSCAVFGMPKAAIQTGCIDFTLPPDKIRQKIVELFGILPPKPTL